MDMKMSSFRGHLRYLEEFQGADKLIELCQ